MKLIVAATSTALLAAVYVLRLDQAAGLYVDDAWYIVLATAVWQGDGFRLISSATTPILPAFPPGFALILAPIVGAFPEFPGNVVPLKMVSLVAMGGVGALVYVFLTRYHAAPRAVAATVAVITVAMPAFVFLATSTVMAEPVFTAAQLCAAVAVERSARAPSRTATRNTIIAGLVAGATLLIRLAGVAAVLAATCYLAKKRGVRPAAVFLALATACYLPWGMYSYLNRAPAIERAAHGGSVSYAYRELLMMRHGGEAASGSLTAAEWPNRIGSNLLNIFGRDVGGMVLPAVYRTTGESGYEVFGMTGETGIRASSMGRASGTVILSLTISAIALAGFIGTIRRAATVAEWMVPATVAMVVLVPAPTFRYVLPLAPFIVFYFLAGLDAIVGAARRSAPAPTAAFRITAACLLVLFAVEHASYVWRARRGPRPVWIEEFEEARQVTDWLGRNGSGFVASNNPGLVYLATGLKGVSMGNAPANWSYWQQLGVRYAAALRPVPKPRESLPYTPVFETSGLKLWVVRLPDP